MGDVFSRFLEEYSDFKKLLSQKRFKQWLEEYCKFYGYKYKEGNTPPIGRWFTVENEGQMWEDLKAEEGPKFA